MKAEILILLLFISSEWLFAQQMDVSQKAPDTLVQSYFSGVQEHALIFNGKEYTRYGRQTTNHPYFIQEEFKDGSVCYDGIVYPQVKMRLDLYRNELTVIAPNKPYPIIVEKERVDYIKLHDHLVLNTRIKNWKNMTDNEYIVLLHDGTYPVFKKYTLKYEEQINQLAIEASFRIQEQFFICKENFCYPVKNKKSILDLFPDKKKELGNYIRQQKMNFKKQPEQAFVTIVEQYETISK